MKTKVMMKGEAKNLNVLNVLKKALDGTHVSTDRNRQLFSNLIDKSLVRIRYSRPPNQPYCNQIVLKNDWSSMNNNVFEKTKSVAHETHE